VESGGLMSYGPDQSESYRRAASMIDKILKGTKPAFLSPLLNRRQPVLEGVHIAWRPAFAFQSCHFVSSHVTRFIFL
jgi:hypothetical protein